MRDRDIRVLVSAMLAQLGEETAKALMVTIAWKLLMRWKNVKYVHRVLTNTPTKAGRMYKH